MKNNLMNNDTFKDGIESNINFFLKIAQVIRVLFILIGITFIIIGIINIENNAPMTILCSVLCVLFIVIGILIAPFLEWKSYTLMNLYEINKKIK